MSKDWDDEARRDIEARRAAHARGGALSLRLNGHAEKDDASVKESEGNGRTGFQVLLTVKQVSIVLGIAVTVATGGVAVWTREPAAAKAEARLATPPAPDPRVEAIARALEAHVDELDQMRTDVHETRQEIRELKGDFRELESAVRDLARQVALARKNNVSSDGGSK